MSINTVFIDSLTTSLVASSAIVAIFISVGVQIFFKTSSFDSEYSEKVKAIQEMKNSILVDKIETSKGTICRPKSIESGPMDEGDTIREFEALATIRELAGEVESWIKIIEEGKQTLRKLGIYCMILGLLFGAIFLILILTKNIELVTLLIEYLAGIPLVAVGYYTRSYKKILERIDGEYIKVKRREVGNRGDI